MNWLLDKVASKTTAPFKIFRSVDDIFLAFDKPDDIESTFQTFQLRTQKASIHKRA